MSTPGREQDQERSSHRAAFGDREAALRRQFERDCDGLAAVRARAAAVDLLIAALWQAELIRAPQLGPGVALAALGGYGRSELYPFSDIDLVVLHEKTPASALAAAVRSLSQQLWDGGLRASLVARHSGEVERWKASDPEGSLALLDLRFVDGEPSVFRSVQARLQGRRSARDVRALAGAAAQLTRERHTRFGHTLFHLEPNVKDGPGGLRDLHVVAWLARLRDADPSVRPGPADSLPQAIQFLTSLRVFLHLRHGRDDNTLDWHAQDEAAVAGVGVPASSREPTRPLDPSHWMRLFFRQARVVERALDYELELAGQQPGAPRTALKARAPSRSGFVVNEGRLTLKQPRPDLDPAGEPELVLGAFGLVAETGIRLAGESEERIVAALPKLSMMLEDGPLLWSQLRRILCGRFAAQALRGMHALGLLDLILPEFHGIDALVIRDAYHRYTVDEHTFVLIEALHALADPPPAQAPEWRQRFRLLLAGLPHPEFLYLAALLHDTGKGRDSGDHAAASAEISNTVAHRLELEPFDRQRINSLIDKHLEMSAALRRDIFEAETIHALADKVGTHDLLRMLTLFTYADISAVHPDALTPWKAENLWRLWMAAENQLDRGLDTERIHAQERSHAEEAASIARALLLGPAQRLELEHFLEGAPQRYLRTRSPEIIRLHMDLAQRPGPVHTLLASNPAGHEVTVVTSDRPHLFADLTGALAGWGMNVISAEVFSNAHGTVVDTFRFTDPYRTLELNLEERERFRSSLDAVALEGEARVTSLLGARRRNRRLAPRRDIATGVEFDNMSSSVSTLMQVVAQDAPGLLRAIALVLSVCGCSVEVALIDTEGEMAIDVFYLTRAGAKLTEEEQLQLRDGLLVSLGGELS